MNTIRNFICALAIVLATSVTSHAQSTTQIADTVRNPDNSLFTGTVVITWTGTTTPYGNNPVPYSTSVKVYSGVLSVSVVPTVAYSAYYLVVYNSADGRTSWVENWQVGPSTSALTLAQVRTPLGTAAVTSSGSMFSMGQITGLSAYLNAISGSLSTVSATVGNFNSTLATISNSVTGLTGQVNALQTAAVSNTGSSIWVEGETPSGYITGTNATFTLANTPYLTTSVLVYRNGVLLSPGNDFSVAGKVINFSASALPQSGDVLQASYRVAAAPANVTYVDNEQPQGSALVYTLVNSPTANTLRLYKNGALLLSGTDFVLSGATITFLNTVSAPATSDALTAYYRTTAS